MFAEINASASQVSTGAKQIAGGAQALAQGSTEQAPATEQLSASIGDVADKTNQNARIAREAAGLSGEIRGSAEIGAAQMDNMMQAVKDINDASSQIGKVIKVIDDIAFQTNILALNAAVEAARAGQHGKGFAVVAEEVRNLAAKSAEAAKDTGTLIENSIEKANLGLSIATDTSESLGKIVDGINRSADIISQIARSSEEQSAAIAQINTGIDQVAQVVQMNSATAEESAAASEQMSSQSDMLAQTIARFKLKDMGRYPSLPAGDRNQGRFSALAEKTSLASDRFEEENQHDKYMLG
jgi:methyl-accepting chemotaxis protein